MCGTRGVLAKWPRVVRPSDRGSLGQVAAARSAKWPRLVRPSGRGSLGQVAAARSAKWPSPSAGEYLEQRGGDVLQALGVDAVGDAVVVEELDQRLGGEVARRAGGER